MGTVEDGREGLRSILDGGGTLGDGRFGDGTVTWLK